MNFATPMAFLWALLAIPIVVFYILKVRLRRAPTSTNLFWSQIYDEKPPRSIWETLKHLLSLLAQLAILLLLVFAVADPFLPWQAKSARRVVLIVDRSASMRANDVSPTRLDAAVQEAVKMAEGLRYQDRMAIVAAGGRPQVLLGMSDHVPTLKRTIRAIAPSDAPTELASAVELGKRLIGDHPRGEIVLLTDGCSPEIQTLASDKQLHVRTIGGEAGNVGITQFQTRRSLVDPLGYELLVGVTNASPGPVDCRLELELNDAVTDIIPLKLKAGESWSRALEKTSLDGGTLVGKLTGMKQGGAESGEKEATPSAPTPFGDHLASDNTAHAILPARTIQKVLLVSPGNLFLRKAFESNPLVSLQVVDQIPDELPADTLIVLHRLPIEKLPTGSVWVIDPDSSSDHWTLAGELEHPIVTHQDAASALMTHVKLNNVIMPKARKIAFQSPAHVVAGGVTGDPIYAEVKRPSGKLLVLTASLEEGDLTFRTAFPIIVTNALAWFAGMEGELQPALTTGGIAHVNLPVEQTDGDTAGNRFLLVAPDGSKHPLAANVSVADQEETRTGNPPDTGTAAPEITITIGPLDQCGIWKIVREQRAGQSNDENPIAAYACNLSNVAESQINVPEELRQTSIGSLRAAGWGGRPIWQYLAAAVLLLATVEWFLYQRRLIR